MVSTFPVSFLKFKNRKMVFGQIVTENIAFVRLKQVDRDVYDFGWWYIILKREPKLSGNKQNAFVVNFF